MIDIQPLDLSVPQPDVLSLTYPRFRRRLLCEDTPQMPQLEGPVISNGFVAILDDQPIALALLGGGSSDTVRLLSIMVASSFRRSGVGARLIARVEATARTQGASKIEAHFVDDASRDPFRALTRAAGWSTPEPLNFRLAGRADWTTRMGQDWPRFITRIHQSGFSTTAWCDVDSADRAKADALVAEQEGNEVIIKYKGFEDYSDDKLSIAIRRYGELVGYIHGETLPQNGFRYYSTGYVSQPLQRAGWLIAGLDDVCRRQAAAYGPESQAVYETYGNNLRMIEFMRRRLGPVFTWMKARQKVEKVLTSEVVS